MALTASIAVVEGLSAEEIADRLDTDLTEETVDFYAALQAVGVHGESHAVVLDNPYDDAPALEDERLLARLSRATKVVLFAVNEHVNCGIYMTSCWADGVMVWKITHNREEPETEEFQVLGVAPAGFGAIAAPYRAKQDQADAAGEYTCFLGDAVIELFASLTDIKWDSSGWWNDIPYQVLRGHPGSHPG